MSRCLKSEHKIRPAHSKPDLKILSVTRAAASQPPTARTWVQGRRQCLHSQIFQVSSTPWISEGYMFERRLIHVAKQYGALFMLLRSSDGRKGLWVPQKLSQGSAATLWIFVLRIQADIQSC